MGNGKRDISMTEVMKRFCAFAYDITVDEAKAMSDQEVKELLDEEGIDVKPSLERINQLVASKRKASEYSEARARAGEIGRYVASVGLRASMTKEQMMGILRSALGGTPSAPPEMAQAVFRKFDGMSEGDMKALVEDIEFLKNADK